jgi:ADP-ribosyl-[dinitrogen reductase] hydrolase
MNDITTRAEGAFIGLACGNALGLPYEDIWPASRIREASGGSIRDIPEAEAATPWDDDTAHAVVVAELLAATGNLHPNLLGERLVAWRHANGRGIGILTEKVLDEIEGDIAPLEASEEASERLGRNWSAGNGAVVRAVPVAIFARSDRARMVKLAADAARTTHWNSLCVGSTVAFTLALADALEGKACDLATLAETIAPMGYPEAIAQAISGARLPLSAFQLDGKQKGFTLKALQVGLWALRAEGSIEDLLERIILEGGDTDTNAAIAGAALGARHGIAAIPQRWIDRLHEPDHLKRSVSELLHRAA